MAQTEKSRKKTPAAAPYIDHGEALPRSYGENRIAVMVRDPETLYVYWDVESDVRVAGSGRLLRISNLTEGVSWDFEPGTESDNWYVRVSSNRIYRVELFERRAGGQLRLLASSGEVATPLRHAGESGRCAPEEITHVGRFPLARSAEETAARYRVRKGVPHTPKPVHVPAPFMSTFGGPTSPAKGR